MDLEAAPLDGKQGTLRSHDMDDTQPMTEEEGVVALGSNSMGVHTTQLRNKPKTKKSKPKEFNNRMSPKGLRQLIEKLNDKQKEAVKEIGFGGFFHLQLDMIPGKLALVRNFDTCPCSLPLTHSRFRVIEHDVYMTLALPKGPFEVTEVKIRNSKPYSSNGKNNGLTEIVSLNLGRCFVILIGLFSKCGLSSVSSQP
ncbi:LOW QUALITY PROTEIN: hypothetical protein Cgig2_009191 [Carnegiea gigantea]|uniref:Uncharacterized protein n=1 Tax=Carnegiea gigantea TaxID=171969 RepID=A0A9Q1JHA2_9CARY|nr:LOW QUALITY PROTEIN: hypothetical protein Cgig2_009191 [Carnegiea gigantea]